MTRPTPTPVAGSDLFGAVEPSNGRRLEARSRPPLAVTPDEAAQMLRMSRDSFDRHVRDEIRVVRRGRMVRVPVVELERWLDRSAARTLEGWDR